MEYFVAKESVVRTIWGKADTILFIFGGAAAEFALNKAVDWLYFTGKLPADPVGRLFSTVRYAREIVFSENEAALRAIDKITAIHGAVEKSRGAQIPDWAYRDVLFMLIDYSIRSFELLERKLTEPEKEEVFNVFYRVGDRMMLKGLPRSYSQWLHMRADHLQNDLIVSHYSQDLLRQYRRQLGAIRYRILWEGQILVVPLRVRQLLHMRSHSFGSPLIALYKIARTFRLDWLIKSAILPPEYKAQIRALDVEI